MPDATPTTTPTQAPPPVSPDILRAQEIRDLGAVLEEPELAREFIADDKTPAEFKAAVKAQQTAARAATQPPPEDPAVAAQRSGGNVQLARSVPRFATLKHFKGEGAEQRAYRFGQWFLGAMLGRSKAAQFCKEQGIVIRALSEGVNEKGGFTVPEEFGNDLIDLREQFGVFRRNAKIRPMISDRRTDPRRTGGLTAYFVDEGDAIPVSDKAWDRVGLTAKKLACLARLSTEVNEDSSINMGDDLMGEVAYAFSNKEDASGFIGDGTSTYGGITGVCPKIKSLSGTIANIAGLVVATGTGYASSYAATTLADFEAVVGKLPQYADTPTAKWFCHRSYFWNVMVKLMLASGGVTAAEVASGRIQSFMGYPVEFAQVMPKNPAVSQVCALLGDLSKAASIGDRRTTTLAISEHSRFSNDELEIRGTERVDINVHDVGNASATAANRVEGPVVGLITASN